MSMNVYQKADEISYQVFRVLKEIYDTCVEEEIKNDRSKRSAEGVCLLRVFVSYYKDYMGYIKMFVHQRVENFVSEKMKELVEEGA